jgi:hypothetical protein
LSGTPIELADALADALLDISPSENVQVHARMLFSPTPPAFDIYPSSPAEGLLAFGPDSRTHFFTVRLRVSSADEDGQQDLLLRARETSGPNSVRAAILDDPTLGGLADNVDVMNPTGFQLYVDGQSRLVGQEWSVAVMVGSEPS